MNKASSPDLKKLHEAANDVYQAVVKGASPTDAVVKVAADLSMSRNWTQRLCEVTNRLLTLDYQAKAEPDKRANSHPLVDTDAVMAATFPTTVAGTKAASVAVVVAPASGSRRYTYANVSGSTEKSASADAHDFGPGDPLGGSNAEDVLRRGENLLRQLKTAGSIYRTVKAAAATASAELVVTAIKAIKQAKVDSAAVEERAVAWFGKDAHAVFGQMQERCPGLTRFQGTPRPFTTNPWDQSPYREIKEAVIGMRQHALSLDTYARVNDIASRGAAMLEHGIRRVAGVKQAGGALEGVAGVARTAASIQPAKKVYDILQGGEGGVSKDMATPFAFDMTTAGLKPEDVSFLNGIQSREALVHALRDPVIQRSSLVDIIKMYNRLGTAAPRGMMNEASLVSALRQSLEAEQSTHDVEQLQKIETGLANQADVTSPAGGGSKM